MPVKNKDKGRPTSAAIKKVEMAEFTVEPNKTTGPFDLMNIFCRGVRIGQFTLIHGQPASDFMRLITDGTGVVVVVDKFSGSK